MFWRFCLYVCRSSFYRGRTWNFPLGSLSRSENQPPIFACGYVRHSRLCLENQSPHRQREPPHSFPVPHPHVAKCGCLPLPRKSFIREGSLFLRGGRLTLRQTVHVHRRVCRRCVCKRRLSAERCLAPGLTGSRFVLPVASRL